MTFILQQNISYPVIQLLNIKQMNKSMKNKKGSGFAYGLIIGTVIGAITGNMGLWLALGVVFGAGFEAKSKRESAESNS